MITLGGVATKIYLAADPIDLRRGYSGLYTLVQHQFGGEPQQGHLWVFTNKRRDMLKIFWWDTGGMVVLAKKLHEGTFQAWPQRGEKLFTLTSGELQLLLDGLELARLRPRKWVRAPRTQPPAVATDAAAAR